MKEASPVVGGLLRIHKIISRGLRVSVMKCDEYADSHGITPGEAEGFSRYIAALKWVIHAHHLSEDEIAFPYFKNDIAAPYDRLQDDHRKMANILVEIDQRIPEILFGKTAKLRDVLHELEQIWIPHIGVEEENFTIEKVQKIKGMEEQEELADKLTEHGIKNSGPGPLTLPFMIYNLQDNDREAFLMPLPWIVKKILVPVVWKGQWKSMSPFLL
jgi:hypothetical protein